MKLLTARLTLIALTVLTVVDSLNAQTRRRYLPEDVRESVERVERGGARRLPPPATDTADVEPELGEPESMPSSQVQEPPMFQVYDAYRNYCGNFVADGQGVLYRVVGSQVAPQPEGRLVRQQDARTFIAVNFAGQPFYAVRIR